MERKSLLFHPEITTPLEREVKALVAKILSTTPLDPKDMVLLKAKLDAGGLTLADLGFRTQYRSMDDGKQGKQ